MENKTTNALTTKRVHQETRKNVTLISLILNDMKQLSEYTDDELRAELKRRAQERKKNQKHEIVYVEFDATIACVDNTMGYKPNGDVRYKPFIFWKYIVKDCSYEFARRNKHIDVFYLKQAVFKRDNAPQVGDRVRLRYRRTKSSEIFDFQKAKIIQILKED